jgi:hypothetical protein
LAAGKVRGKRSWLKKNRPNGVAYSKQKAVRMAHGMDGEGRAAGSEGYWP